LFLYYQIYKPKPSNLNQNEKTIGQIKTSIIREKTQEEDDEENLKNFNGEMPKIKDHPLILKMKDNQEITNPIINSLKHIHKELI